MAIAVTGSYGFRLDAGTSFISEGTVPSLNRLVHYQTVQEQPRDWYIGSLLGANGSGQTALRMRLTEVSACAGSGYPTLLASAYSFKEVSLLDCQLHRTWLYLCPVPVAGINPVVGLTNNLFNRCQVSLYHSSGALNTPITSRLLNNLFTGGGLTLVYDLGSSNPTWSVQDNVFDQATQAISGNSPTSIARSYNAFTTGTANSLGGTSVFTGLSRDFQSGPLGPYYYPAAGASPSLAALADAGSRSASLASLLHHTVRVDQTKDSGNVAVGFHYLAASPAEVEIPKSTMTADCSSSGYGWLAAYAIDGSTADPGWHNTTATEEPAWLRIDLHAQRTVSRVGYVSRTGTANNFNGGQSNGAFREYRIYVTDDPSPNVSAWGNPVASGYWNWPNGQERRDVSFEPKSGRYVIFRRISASGYNTPPGYANANEVWVFEHAGEAAAAADADGDGLPDYCEDANGNGVTEAGETDPLHPLATDQTSLQGEAQSPGPEVWVSHYKLKAKRDFTVQGRGRTMGDLESAMEYFRKQAGTFTVKETFGETTDPWLGPYIWEFTWPVSGLGEAWWYDPVQSWVYEGPAPIPGFAFEKCARPVSDYELTFGPYDNDPQRIGVYQRYARTTVKLNAAGPNWPKRTRSVVLSFSAVDKSAGDTLFGAIQAPPDLMLFEPNTAALAPPIDPVLTEIRIDGERVDPSGSVMVQAVKDFPYDVTPSLQCDWYLFDLVPSGPKTVRLSWSKHPTVGSVPDVQAAFDGGAKILARDDDAPVRDGTPGLDEIGDDVNTYMEFIVPKAKKSTFPAGYTDDRWNNIATLTDAVRLIDASFANVKLVSSIVLADQSLQGFSPPWHDGILVIPSGVTGRVLVHEYGHVVGLEHRGSDGNAELGTWQNPGDWDDTTALMYHKEPPGPGTEVNRFERAWFLDYTPALFND